MIPGYSRKISVKFCKHICNGLLVHAIFQFSPFQSMVKVVGKPSKTDPIKSQISSTTSRGKMTAQSDINKDITNDSQVNSYFPYRWSPASLTFKFYFYLFLYLYITRITINNDALHLKSPKNQNRRAALGRPAIKLLGGFN